MRCAACPDHHGVGVDDELLQLAWALGCHPSGDESMHEWQRIATMRARPHLCSSAGWGPRRGREAPPHGACRSGRLVLVVGQSCCRWKSGVLGGAYSLCWQACSRLRRVKR